MVPRTSIGSLGLATALAGGVGVLCGIGSALFLWLLDTVTTLRVEHRWIVYGLPAAGWLVGVLYERAGSDVQAGNNLVIDRLVEGGAQVPPRMAPAVLLGTLITHLFGGSAGREGTAVQMGASLADDLAHRLGVAPEVRHLLLVAGVAGGFGSVFGTPWAGAVFGIEVARIGRLDVRAVLPALVASFVGDAMTLALGTTHTAYPIVERLGLSPRVIGAWLLFAVAVALVTVTFVELTHAIKRSVARLLPRLPWRAALGGVVVVLLWHVAASDDYLGLGLPTLVRAFTDPRLADDAFAWKLMFTAVTIGCGFIGGEVTALFFVGATLGNVLTRWLHLPLALGAGVGMAAVFAAASNAPLALSLMALELLGVHALPHVAMVCVLSFALSGHRGIYGAQRIVRTKWGRAVPQPVALRDWDQMRQSAPTPSSGPE